MPRALITGISGQDGAWLARHLLDRGYEVHGTYRRAADRSFARLHQLGIADQIAYVLVEMCEPSNLIRALDRVKPDEIYHLAAQSFVGSSFEQPAYTFEVNATGTARLLDAVRLVVPEARLYHASTSEMFGGATDDRALDESAPFRPRSPYAISKLAAHHLVINHRESYGIFGCNGILFNHESELRGPEFVTRKITLAAVAIASGRQEVLRLGNLDASRDWGYAPEYVDAMHRMLQRDTPSDYVVATGVTTTVRRFATLAFAAAGVPLTFEGSGLHEVGRDRDGIVRIAVDPAFFRPAEVHWLRGDAARATAELGWTPSTSVEGLVERMVAADRDALPG